MPNLSEMPYAQWLEKTIEKLFETYPVSISMQMVDSAGQVYTCYWNMDYQDRTAVIAAMHEDSALEFLRNNKDLINAILNGEEDGE